jgi:molybdopterin-guanine dinucleotide biosynthesis protein A
VKGAEKSGQSIRGYVLAGGASSRFGRDKALVEIGGQTVLSRMCGLIEEVADEVQVVSASERYADLQARIVEDRWPGEGPLGGIITALAATVQRGVGCEWNLIVSCDMPFLTRDWLSYVIERALAGAPENRSRASLGMTGAAEVVVPRSRHGLEPLCACWRTSSAAALQGAFDEGVRKVTEAMKRLRMEVLDAQDWKRFDSAGRLFWNMNTQQDYQEALRVWETEKA